MEFQEILAEGPIKIERLATKPANSASNEGRVIYVRDEQKIYYGNATVWSEISSGASGDLISHIADATTHGSNGNIAGDSDVSAAISDHIIDLAAHSLATTSRPGFVRILNNSTTQYLNGAGEWADAVSTATKKTVTQAAHGLVIGNVVRLNGALYVKAIATAAADAEVVGIVSAVNSSSSFDLTHTGYVSELSGLTAGSLYFLSESTAGTLSLIEPSTAGYVSKPLLLATSTTEGYFFNWRGSIIAEAAGLPVATTDTQGIVELATNAETLTGTDALRAVTPVALTYTLNMQVSQRATAYWCYESYAYGASIPSYSNYAWTPRRLNNSFGNIAAASLNLTNYQISLPSGSYIVMGQVQSGGGDHASIQSRIRNITLGTTSVNGLVHRVYTDDDVAVVSIHGFFYLPTTSIVEFQYYGSSDGFTTPNRNSGETSVISNVVFLKIL